MSSNKIVINDSDDYTFEVSDEVCDGILSLCRTGEVQFPTVAEFVNWFYDMTSHFEYTRSIHAWFRQKVRPQKTAEGKQNNHQHLHTAIALSKYSDYLRETGGTEDSQFVDWLARQQQ